MSDWRDDLVRRFPALFLDASGQPTGGYPTVGDGWRILLTRCCERITAALARAPAETVRVGQIKEKFGTLRIYVDVQRRVPDGVREDIREAIDLAEARSACTCETCGDPGWLSGDSWITTSCDRHRRGPWTRQPKPHDFVIVQRRLVDGKWVRTARRYVPERDCFEPAPVPPGHDEK
jgi:hypothetical protein